MVFTYASVPSASQNNRSQDTSGRYGYNRSGSEAFITPVSSPKESSPGTPTDEDDSKEETPFQDTTEETTTNFLILEYKFDFSLTPEGEIPTEAYLKASKGLLTFLGKSLVYVYVYIRVHVFVYVRIYVCMYVFVCICTI